MRIYVKCTFQRCGFSDISKYIISMDVRSARVQVHSSSKIYLSVYRFTGKREVFLSSTSHLLQFGCRCLVCKISEEEKPLCLFCAA